MDGTQEPLLLEGGARRRSATSKRRPASAAAKKPSAKKTGGDAQNANIQNMAAMMQQQLQQHDNANAHQEAPKLGGAFWNGRPNERELQGQRARNTIALTAINHILNEYMEAVKKAQKTIESINKRYSLRNSVRQSKNAEVDSEYAHRLAARLKAYSVRIPEWNSQIRVALDNIRI